MATATATDESVLAERVSRARKIVASAKRRATRLAGDQAVNRSTRTRAALKVKADAFDEIEQVLAGKA